MRLFEYFPITVVSAIALFAVKEAVEWRRRWLAQNRKRRALRKLISRECEMNLWVVKTLRTAAEAIRSELNEDEKSKFSAETLADGKFYLRIWNSRNEMVAGLPLGSPKRELMEKNLLDVATIDAKFFAVLEPAYDAVAELQNARDQIVSVVETKVEEEKDHIYGLDEYVLRTTHAAYERLNALYIECTGKKLESHRLR